MKALYRIVSALAIVLTVPAFYFMKLFRIVIDLGFMDGYFDDSFSVQDIIRIMTDYGVSVDSFELNANLAQTLAPMKTTAIVTLVFLCLTVLMILAVFICSVFTNARKVNLVFSIVGAISVIGTIASFNNLTDIVISGEVPLSDIVNALLADSGNAIAAIAALLGAGSAVSLVGELVIFQLGSAFNAALLIFIFIVIWSLSFILINLDSYNVPKAKKAKKKS